VNTGALIGGIVGGIAVGGIIMAIVYFVCIYSKRNRDNSLPSGNTKEDQIELEKKSQISAV